MCGLRRVFGSLQLGLEGRNAIEEDAVFGGLSGQMGGGRVEGRAGRVRASVGRSIAAC